MARKIAARASASGSRVSSHNSTRPDRTIAAGKLPAFMAVIMTHTRSALSNPSRTVSR
jgi:hypothetical protein